MRYPRATALVAAALALVGSANAWGASAASTKLRAPTLLWQSYPLVERPGPEGFELPGTAIAKTPTLQVPAGGYGTSTETLLLFLVGSFAASVAGLFLLRSSLFEKPETFGPSMPWPAEPQRQNEAASDQMDLSVALRPSSRLGLDSDETEEVPTNPDSNGRSTGLAAPRPLGWEGEPPGKEQRRLQEAPPEPARATGVEICQVFLWSGHRKHQLYAASLAEEAASRPLAFSTHFPLRDEEIPTEQASAALDKLITQLEREGWGVSALGTRWYDLTFERRPRE
jgi:hypothetical protein